MRSSAAATLAHGAVAVALVVAHAACGGDDGAAIDAPVADAAIDGATIDGPNADASPFVNNCTPALAVDRRDGAAERVVTFVGLIYTPGCIRIAAGQTVTFRGDFLAHPLVGGILAGGGGSPDPGSPITATSTGAEATFTFPAAGIYPYYCVTHAADLMGGVGLRRLGGAPGAQRVSSRPIAITSWLVAWRPRLAGALPPENGLSRGRPGARIARSTAS